MSHPPPLDQHRLGRREPRAHRGALAARRSCGGTSGSDERIARPRAHVSRGAGSEPLGRESPARGCNELALMLDALHAAGSYCALASAGPGQGLGTDLWLVSIGLFCLSSLMSAVGFVATTTRHRAPGMTWLRMPLTCWSWFVTSILIQLAFGILLAAVVLLMLDRHAGTSFFIPGGLLVSGKAIIMRAAHR